MNRLFIDVGSTNVKFLSEINGKQERESIPFSMPVLDDGCFYEVNAKQIVLPILQKINQTDCDEVYLSVQMHGYLLADREGELLTNYISWRDNRAKRSGTAVEISAESGSAMKWNLPRASVFSIKKEDPFCYQRIKRFFTLGSYLVFCMLGVNATHVTDAAASGFYNVKERTAAKEPFELPNAYYHVAPIGTYRGKRIYPPFGDQQCAVFGVGCDENSAVLNLGTAAQACTPAHGFVCGAFESRPYFGGNTLCTVTGLSGGRELSGGNARAALLAEEYTRALSKLPQRQKLIVTGGCFRYYRPILEEVLSLMDVSYTVDTEADALIGLKKIAEVNL